MKLSIKVFLGLGFGFAVFLNSSIAQASCQGVKCAPPKDPMPTTLPVPLSAGPKSCTENCTPPNPTPPPVPTPTPPPHPGGGGANQGQSLVNNITTGDTRVNSNSAAAVFNFGQGPEGASVFKAGANGFVCQAPITTLEIGSVGSIAASKGRDSFYSGQPTAYTATMYGRVNIPLGGSGLKSQCSNMLTLQQCVALLQGGIDIVDSTLVDPRLAKMCPGLGKKTVETVVVTPRPSDPKPATIYVKPQSRPVFLPPAVSPETKGPN
jgi:hypothetical protein